MIKVETNISEKYKDITVLIKAPEYTSEIDRIVTGINEINQKQELIAYKENNIYIIKLKDIVCIFSNDKRNYLKTLKGVFEIKNTLYSLEELLPKNKFIRISNSYIINIDKVESFDVSIVGSIVAIMVTNDHLSVSKRRIREVMKFLKERR